MNYSANTGYPLTTGGIQFSACPHCGLYYFGAHICPDPTQARMAMLEARIATLEARCEALWSALDHLSARCDSVADQADRLDDAMTDLESKQLDLEAAHNKLVGYTEQTERDNAAWRANLNYRLNLLEPTDGL